MVASSGTGAPNLSYCSATSTEYIVNPATPVERIERAHTYMLSRGWNYIYDGHGGMIGTMDIIGVLHSPRNISLLRPFSPLHVAKYIHAVQYTVLSITINHGTVVVYAGLPYHIVEHQRSVVRYIYGRWDAARKKSVLSV